VNVNVQTMDDVRRFLADLIHTGIRTGTVDLVGGTATVTGEWVGSDTPIFLCGNAEGSGTEGFMRVSSRTAGTSFTILSSQATDTSTVAWLAVCF
jgi:hypothetical protein